MKGGWHAVICQDNSKYSTRWKFYNNDGNILMVRTLDLTQDFVNIKKDLENLINYKY